MLLTAVSAVWTLACAAYTAACAEAIETQRLDDIPNDSLGQAFGAIVRLYAAKAQMGEAPRPYGRNAGVTARRTVSDPPFMPPSIARS